MRFDLDKGEMVGDESDRAAACVPGRLKSLDASIDRSKRETAQAERAAKKENTMRTRIYRAEARRLIECGLAQIAVRHHIALGCPPTLSEMGRILKSDAWYNPEAVVELALRLGVRHA